MPNDPTTPGRFAERYRIERQDAYRQRPGDGPWVTLIKWLFGLPCWHWLIEWYIPRALRRKGVFNQVMDRENARLVFNQAVEEFWVWGTLATLAGYACAFAAAHQGPIRSLHPGSATALAIVLGLLSLAAGFRIIELLGLSLRLHVLERYWTRAPAHALILTFVGYFQVMVCFAILHLAAAYVTGDKYSEDTTLWAEFLNAAYFSTATIGTLGFGDFAPVHWFGKLLVIAEVFVGLVLIVVAFQRVIAAIAEQSNDSPTGAGDEDVQTAPGVDPATEGSFRSEQPMNHPPTIRKPGEGRTVGVVGDVYRFLATGEDTDGRNALLEALVPPGGGPPPHTHSREEEAFYILEGEVTFTINGERLVATPGMFANMPVGSLHSFKNESGTPAKMLISVAPAGLEQMFFDVGQPLEAGATTAPTPAPDDIEKLLAAAPRYGVGIRRPPH
jgi:quercetin dioxygenase-like cupin family protein